MTELSIAVTVLPHAKGLELPSYATEHAAGMDLYAAVQEDVVLKPNERKLIIAARFKSFWPILGRSLSLSRAA